MATLKHKNPCPGSASLRAISRSNYKGGHFTYVCSDHFPHGDGRTWKHEVPTQPNYRVQKKHTFRNGKWPWVSWGRLVLLYNPLNYHKDNMIFKNVLKDLNIVFISLASLMHGTYTNHKGWLSVILLTIILCMYFSLQYLCSCTCMYWR